MKLKIIFAYDGSHFQGSASQAHQNTVQDKLSSALHHLGIFERALFASRTDKGVHALNAVASVVCGEHFKDLNALKNRLNYFAHPHIHIKHIQRVDDDFQVRFHAKMRTYRYLLNHGTFSPFLAPYFFFCPQIELSKTNEILSHFVGKHDFKMFQKQNEAQKDSIRTIYRARAYHYKHLSVLEFKADGFLRSQIRLIVAAVFKVLEKKISTKELKEQINALKEHSRTPALPNGLYLNRIFY